MSLAERFAEYAPQVEVMDWPTFSAQLEWEQGEHVTLLGPTGCGKTTLARALLRRRGYVVWFETKPRDATVTGLTREGYRLARDWPPPAGRRIILWPKIDRRQLKWAQRETFRRAIDSIYETGGWCVYADELDYLSNDLRLERGLRDLWQQGRSIGISLMAGTQRPAWVPLAAYTQASHIFFWRTQHSGDLKKMGGMGGLDDKLIRSIVMRLPGTKKQGWPLTEACAFLYVGVRSGRLIVSRLEL